MYITDKKKPKTPDKVQQYIIYLSISFSFKLILVIGAIPNIIIM